VDLTGVDWPSFGLEDDIRPLLKSLIARGRPSVLATLFAGEGGSPRGLGAQMLIADDAVSGYLSGGCVEADVALHARQVMADGRAKRLIYGRGGPADIRLPCGGRIEVLLEHLDATDSSACRLLELGEARIPALWLTDGEQRACLAPDDRTEDLAEPLREGLRAARAGGYCGALGQAVFRRFNPAQRLVVIGADPPALAMAAMGAQVGFETTLARPKGPPALPPAAGVAYLRSSPAQAMSQVGLDAWTAVAVATHDADLDDEAVITALSARTGYVGVLGSKRRLPERLERLRALGVSQEALGRLKAPIGLPLAGKSPWEIAVSVIAEIIQEVRGNEAAEPWPAPRLRTHALVFAAGEGSRYGGAKLLADWRGAPVLHGALRAAFAAPADTVTVVTGAHAHEVGACARTFAATRPDGARLRLVHAADHTHGLSASIREGIRSLPKDAEAAFLFLGDMPRVPEAVLPRLVQALSEGHTAAAPRHGGRRGHPVLVRRALFDDLVALAGDRGAGELLKTLGIGLVLVDSPDDGVHFDIDEPADLEPISPA
jgi:xanthine dehydrogenase accessory factor